MEATDWLAIATFVMVGAERVLGIVAPKTDTKYDNVALQWLRKGLKLLAMKADDKK